ncbi:sugar phosphate isomerase/epimerase family protein [Clostridium amazonitimonense]|uniref:sugar phosphate isomerase/epimerase family protein n=1 Tax=Clostridium amazonitimonense TaxID=1499689 RepID=UPI000509B79E|nr:sugar phosphate isomerase/epimerase [Clostridium amazonitimonense]
MSCKLGMPTLIEFKEIEENFVLCKELGLDFIELNMNLPYCLPENSDLLKINLLREKYNVDLTMHFPEEIDFGAFYEPVRDANITLFKDYCQWASKLNISKINVHLSQGVYFTLPEEKQYVYDIYKEKFISNLEDSFIKLSSIGKEYGIKLCVENTVLPNFLGEAMIRLSKIDDVYFTWDIGHDAHSKYKAKKLYSNFESKVIHMHMHDYNGHLDHQILFDGDIDLESRLEFMKKNNGTIVIEVKTAKALEESVKRFKEKFY